MQRDGSGSGVDGSRCGEEINFRNVQGRESKVFVGGFDLCGKEKNGVQTENPAVHTLCCSSQLWSQRARAVLEENDRELLLERCGLLELCDNYKNRILCCSWLNPCC